MPNVRSKKQVTKDRQRKAQGKKKLMKNKKKT